jgi:hypothetical protein
VKSGEGDDVIVIGNPEQKLDDIDGLLSVKGGQGNDLITLNDTGDTTNNIGRLSSQAIIGLGMDQQVDYSDIESLNINLGTGQDYFQIEGSHNGTTHVDTSLGDDVIAVWAVAGETTVRTEAGRDVVRVGDQNQALNKIQGNLVVQGNFDGDTLEVINTGDAGDRQGRLTDNMISGLGMLGHIDYGALDSVTIQLGSGRDSLEVLKTHTGETQIDTGIGNDAVTIEAILGTTTIKTGVGDDAITLGGNQQTVNHINASLAVIGGAGHDLLNIDDSGDATNNVGLLDETKLIGLGMSNQVDYGSIEVVNIALGVGSDTFTIAGTPLEQTLLDTSSGNDMVHVKAIAGQTTVKTSDGNDVIQVSNDNRTVNTINASLVIKSGIGSDILRVDDSGDRTDNSALLTQGSLEGMGMNGNLEYDAVESLNLAMGSGNDTITVQDTHDGATHINTALGNDAIAVQGISGETTIKTSAGNDTVNIGNAQNGLDRIDELLIVAGGSGIDLLKTANNLSSQEGAITDTQIQGFGMNGKIDYGSFEKTDLS